MSLRMNYNKEHFRNVLLCLHVFVILSLTTKDIRGFNGRKDLIVGRC